MILDENILVTINCDIYKYNYRTNSFQVRNYFNTDTVKLLEEFDKIIKVLVENKIKFKLHKDNTIEITL